MFHLMQHVGNGLAEQRMPIPGLEAFAGIPNAAPGPDRYGTLSESDVNHRRELQGGGTVTVDQQVAYGTSTVRDLVLDFEEA